MLQALERYLKQAIVDKLPSVSSAALVRSYHLTSGSGDLVKRWVSEVQEALNSEKLVACIKIIESFDFCAQMMSYYFFCSVMVQYHALGVLYHIRKADRLAVTKLVTKLTKSHMKSPFAVSLLVSYSGNI